MGPTWMRAVAAVAVLLLAGGCATPGRYEQARAWHDVREGRPVDVVLPGGAVCRHYRDDLHIAGAVRPVRWLCGPAGRRGIVGWPDLVDGGVTVDLATIRHGRVVATREVVVPVRELLLADGSTCRRVGRPGSGVTARFRCRDGRVVLGAPVEHGDQVRVDVARVEDGRLVPVGDAPVLRLGVALPG